MTKHLFLLTAMISALCVSLRGETYGERLEHLKKTESEVRLYGRLVDQFNKPIVKAEIKYTIEKYGFFKPDYTSGSILSDNDGRFEIVGGKAGALHIEDIVIYGYEFHRTSDNNVSYFDFRTSMRDRHRPDQANPVVFHLRKKQAAGTYLLKKEFKITLQAESEEKYWAKDLAHGWTYRNILKENPNVFWDVEVIGRLDLEQKEWHLTLKTNGEHSGIQIRDDFLYEAPADGYVKSLDVVFPFAEWGKFPVRYLYVRLREPGMYARFAISRYSCSDEEGLIVNCKGVINPYGERSFEELEFDIKKKIEDARFAHYYLDARDAFRKQYLAPRPPFEEWVKKGYARY